MPLTRYQVPAVQSHGRGTQIVDKKMELPPTRTNFSTVGQRKYMTTQNELNGHVPMIVRIVGESCLTTVVTQHHRTCPGLRVIKIVIVGQSHGDRQGPLLYFGIIVKRRNCMAKAAVNTSWYGTPPWPMQRLLQQYYVLHGKSNPSILRYCAANENATEN